MGAGLPLDLPDLAAPWPDVALIPMSALVGDMIVDRGSWVDHDDFVADPVHLHERLIGERAQMNAFYALPGALPSESSAALPQIPHEAVATK